MTPSIVIEVMGLDGQWHEITGDVREFTIDPAWIAGLEYGAKEIRQAEKQLKQIYTDRMNEGMAFGL